MPWTTEAVETGGHFAIGFVPHEAQKYQSECRLEGLHVDSEHFAVVVIYRGGFPPPYI